MDKEKDLKMALQIARRVSDAGGRAYYVGGCVRDAVLHRDSKDIDVEIHGITPECLEGILKSLGEPVTMGSSFGILGLRHYGLDISMPRKENSRGGKDFYDVVDPFVGSLAAARRRDLTINALMQDILTGQIIDHFGGIADLQNGIIRHVDPVTFAEDPLRVLRVAQFAARFQFAVAEETVQLAKTLNLAQISKERIYGELEKALMKSEKPSIFFETLREMGQLDLWFPEVKALIGVKQEPRFHPEGDVWTHTMMVFDRAAQLRSRAARPLPFMLGALCHDFGKVTATTEVDGRIRSNEHETEGVVPAGAFLSRLTNEVGVHNYVLNMVQLHMRPNLMVAQKSSVKSMCKLFDRAMVPEDLILMAKADHEGKLGSESYDETEQQLRAHLEIYRQRMAMPCVTGEDLILAGFRPGKKFKDALEYAHKLQLAGIDKACALKHTVAFLQKEMKADADGSQ